MSIIKRILAIIIIMVLFGLAGCSSGVSQEEYDAVKKELSNSQSQLATLQSNLTEATKNEAKYQELNTQYENLQEQYDAKIAELQDINTELEALQSQVPSGQAGTVTQDEYDSLQQEYDILKSQYDALTQVAVFSEADIDQAIFKMVNEERKNAGMAELTWKNSFYSWARQNSIDMAQKGEYLYPAGAAPEIFWAVGYPSVEKIAEAAITTWKAHDFKYKQNVLNSQNLAGAVGTYESGGVYFITYLATSIE